LARLLIEDLTLRRTAHNNYGVGWVDGPIRRRERNPLQRVGLLLAKVLYPGGRVTARLRREGTHLAIQFITYDLRKPGQD